jgi:hypothetical protein
MSIPKPWYLAGPMTGIPQFNFPLFEATAKRLREAGHLIITPHEMDDPDVCAAAWASPDGAPGTGSPNGETWGDFLSRDVKLVADEAHGVLLLDGWERSRGARLETFVAYLCEKPILYAANMQPVSHGKLVEAWGNVYLHAYRGKKIA